MVETNAWSSEMYLTAAQCLGANVKEDLWILSG